MKNKIGIFPGSFDPITIGHKHVILKAAEIVETLIVGIGFNSTKKYHFTIEEREKWVHINLYKLSKHFSKEIRRINC